MPSTHAPALEADLSACDLEPIRWPGAIQPHGHMLVLHAETLALLASSASWRAQARDAVLAALNRSALAALPAGGAGSSPVGLGRLRVAGLPLMEIAAHRTHAHVIVECEDADPDADRLAPSTNWPAASRPACCRPAACRPCAPWRPTRYAG